MSILQGWIIIVEFQYNGIIYIRIVVRCGMVLE